MFCKECLLAEHEDHYADAPFTDESRSCPSMNLTAVETDLFYRLHGPAGLQPAPFLPEGIAPELIRKQPLQQIAMLRCRYDRPKY
jgi:hypothetical protein